MNSIILGLAQYYQPSICSHAYHAIDRRVNNAALAVWKKLFPKQYNQMQVPLKTLCNLPHRHEGYESKTFAIPIEENGLESPMRLSRTAGMRASRLTRR